MKRNGSIGIEAGLLLPLLLLLPFMGTAQWNAEASLDTNRIRIGEQPTLTITLDHRSKQKDPKIQFPAIGDSLTDRIEVIEKSSIDTLVPAPERAPDLKRITQSFRITSFDTGYHPIPPFTFIVDGDSVRTEPMLLEVQSVQLGKKPEAKPIKDIQRFPYTWKAWFMDHWHWFAIAGGVLLALLLFFLYRRYQKQQANEEPPEPETPPQEVAMERLRELENQKAPQEWGPKEFYTELTYILRHFLEDRYEILALEETTPKILHELSFSEIDEEGKGRVRKILKTADMAKFAKHRPKSDEREESLQDAIAFVQRSTPLNEPEAVERG